MRCHFGVILVKSIGTGGRRGKNEASRRRRDQLERHGRAMLRFAVQHVFPLSSFPLVSFFSGRPGKWLQPISTPLALGGE